MDLFSVKDKVVVVVGGSGTLGGGIAEGFANGGAKIALIGRDEEKLQAQVDKLHAVGASSLGVTADARDRESLEKAADFIDNELGRPNVLINAAGGNLPEATANSEKGFFSVDASALRQVVDLNLFGGAIIPSQVFGKRMTGESQSSIINIASMASMRPLTRVGGYGAAKAAVTNFTQWLAVHLVLDCKKDIRVNAIAPGFFLTAQNEALLMNGDKLSERGEQIIAHTPMGRFGKPEDLVGAAIWLATSASSFVTGTVIPVDGGFSAYAGV